MSEEKKKPNCYDCAHKHSIPGDAHIMCSNGMAHVVGDKHGKRKGWFLWPINFDPVWLVSCDGFKAKEH